MTKKEIMLKLKNMGVSFNTKMKISELKNLLKAPKSQVTQEVEVTANLETNNELERPAGNREEVEERSTKTENTEVFSEDSEDLIVSKQCEVEEIETFKKDKYFKNISSTSQSITIDGNLVLVGAGDKIKIGHNPDPQFWIECD